MTAAGTHDAVGSVEQRPINIATGVGRGIEIDAQRGHGARILLDATGAPWWQSFDRLPNDDRPFTGGPRALEHRPRARQRVALAGLDRDLEPVAPDVDKSFIDRDVGARQTRPEIGDAGKRILLARGRQRQRARAVESVGDRGQYFTWSGAY